MYSLLLKRNIVDYPTNQYAKGRYFSQLLSTNTESLLDYISTGNWVLPNQNPLVQYLVNLSVDIEQSDDYIFNQVASRMYRVASNCKFTSIYNKGISFTNAVFPESNHETLFLVPFGPSAYHDEEYYFNTPLDELRPLKTLYTTDTRIRYAIDRMTDSDIVIDKRSNDYTVVQIDPFALVIGYIRYCRRRLDDERYLGLNPHSYMANYPLATFYTQHNQSVFANLMGSHHFTVDKTKWVKLDIKGELDKYLIWQKKMMEGMVFKSFQHYVQQLCQGTHIGDELENNIYPNPGMTNSFKQMGWIYSFGGMDWSIRYLRLLEYQGRDDKAFRHGLYGFFKHSPTTLTGSIVSPVWVSHFNGLLMDLKTLVIK